MKKLLKRVLEIFAIMMLALILAVCCEGKVKASNFGPGYIQGDYPYNMEFKDIAIGANHTIAIDENGDLWGWGNNEFGQVGYGEEFIYSISPIKIMEGVKFKAVAAKENHSIALDEEGYIWEWGDNRDENLGNVSTGLIFSPTKFLTDIKFSKVFAGSNFNMAIDLEGKVWAWGVNSNGQLGNNTTSNSVSPVKVETSDNFTQISTSYGYSVALDEEGNIWAWGKLEYNANENIMTENLGIVPTKLNLETTFNKISAGKDFILALDGEGDIWVYGNNSYGQLGNGNLDNSFEGFNKITSSGKFKDIQAGENYTIAIDLNGNIWSWGDNTYGQLGKNTIGGYDSSTAKRTNGTIFKKIITGTSTVMTIDEKGRTWGWGNNEFGQIIVFGENIDRPTKITEKTFTVKFYSLGEVVKEQIVAKYEDAIPPDVTLNGCSLQGWDKTYTNITQDLDINAIWLTSYKVEHYLEDIDLQNYIILANETQIIENQLLGSIAIAISKEFEGFEYDEQNPENIVSAEIIQNGQTTLKLHYKRLRYPLTLNTNGGTIENGNITEYAHGVGAMLPTEVTRVGYTFEKWIDEEGNEIIEIGENETGAKTLTAKWIPNNNIEYKIEYYKQTTELGENYIKIEEDVENYIGTTEQEVSVNINENKYEGFVINSNKSTLSGQILGDGSLVLKVYYDREKYNVTLNANNGTIAEGKNITFYAFEVGAILPTEEEISRPGYEFLGWYNDRNEKIEAILDSERGDRAFTAKWSKLLNTNYTIEIYKQNIELSNYEIDPELTQIKKGETEEEIEITEFPEFEGFTLNINHEDTVTRGIISGDGNLKLKLYYNRGKYNVTLNTNGGTINEGNITEYVYGVEKTLPTNIMKSGYTFNGWKDENGNFVEKISVNATGDKTFTADWTVNTTTKYTVEYYKQKDNLKEYLKESTEEKSGATDEVVTIEVNENKYSHYIFNSEKSIISGTITGDENLVLKIYYDRENYNLVLNTNGGTINDENVDRYTYGIETVLPTFVTKNGYIFLGWYNSENSKVEKIEVGETGEKTFTARWAQKDEEVERSIAKEYNLVIDESGVAYITRIKAGKETDEMKYLLRNINGDIKILDKNRKEVTDNRAFRTGDILQITKDELRYEYVIVVRGDINGDAILSTTDLTIFIHKIVGKVIFNTIEEKASDVDGDGSSTLTDLSKIIRIIIGKEN